MENYKKLVGTEKILAKLVSFNTTNDLENKKIMFWVGKFLKNNGFQVKYFSEKNGKVNLCAEYKVSGKVDLYFSGHTDTVPAGENWKSNPYKLIKKGDELFGLGSCDMKSGIASFLSVLEKVDFKKLRKGLGVILTYDEEKEFFGIKSFIKNKKIEKAVVIIAEPTNLIPIAFTKGPVALRIEFLGKAAHGSCPEKGINAILMATRFITDLANNFRKEFSEYNKLFPNPLATLNIGKIAGGDAINKVPSRCVLDLEIRTVEKEQVKKFISLVKKIIEKNKMKARMFAKLKLPPMINANKKFINLVEKITGKKTRAANYATEGSFFPRNNSIVILGPGPDNAHIANEFVSAKSLQKIQEIYSKLIKNICFKKIT